MRLGKVGLISIPKKGNAKECSNYHTIAFISHTSKVMLKILQDRLQQYMNHELSDVQTGFRKGRGTRGQIANICWIIKKTREFQKNTYFFFIDYAKALTAWIRTNCGKFWKRWEYHTTWSASWEICMQVKKPQLELDMRQQTGSKLGKESLKAVYCHPAYLTYMQSTSWKWQPTPVILPGEFHGQRSLSGYSPWGCKESVMTKQLSLTYTSCKMLGWMKHKMELRLPGEISITSDMQMIPPLWQKAKKN